MSPFVKKDRTTDGARPKRTPLGTRNRLTFNGMEPGYHYHVLNDTEDRIERALEGGYEFVESEQPLGDVTVGEAGSLTKRVMKHVGGGTKAYLMRIKEEFYNEDRAAKKQEIDSIEAALKPSGLLNGTGVTKG